MKKNIFILSGCFVLVDQLVKLLITNVLSSGNIVVIKNFFSLSLVKNTGAAWGIFSGNRWFLIIVTILSVFAIAKYFLLDLNVTKGEYIAYILLLGGIFGNLIDRILFGYVRDYLDFNFGSYNFPVFNIADAAIVIGVVIVVYQMVKNTIYQRSTK